MTGPRRLGVPVPARVLAGPGGKPLSLDGARIDAVVQTWLVEDRWWEARPLRRRYWEVVAVGGRVAVLFHDLVDGTWHAHR